MDEDYYSEKTVQKFIKKDMCQNDNVLYTYFQNGDVKKFRRRLQILKVDQKVLEQAVYVYITDSIRDIILSFVGKLTLKMKPMGDMVISGGEAFNVYFARDDRIITSDIDTKFVPRFLSPFDKKFFGLLQVCKLVLWNRLGKISEKFAEKAAKHSLVIDNSSHYRMDPDVPLIVPQVNSHHS